MPFLSTRAMPRYFSRDAKLDGAMTRFRDITHGIDVSYQRTFNSHHAEGEYFRRSPQRGMPADATRRRCRAIELKRGRSRDGRIYFRAPTSHAGFLGHAQSALLQAYAYFAQREKSMTISLPAYVLSTMYLRSGRRRSVASHTLARF